MVLTAGRRLGPYEIVAPLGSGGMGEVYEARDTRLDRRVALKILRPALLADLQARRRFEREARALSALSHHNICTIFDVGREDGVDFIVMEYIEGQTMAELLDRQALTEPTIIRYAGQIAEALAEAHEHGVLHRDIKPQNVMVTPRGHVKVLDFGLSRAVGGDPPAQAATVTALSDAAVVLGTAPYMSRLRLETDRRSSSTRAGGTRNPQAYEAYLKGRLHLGARGYSVSERRNSDTAIEMFERATRLDPGYADAHAALGFALGHTANFIDDDQTLVDRAKQATNTADALSPGLAQVHLNRAMILWSWYEGWRLADSIREYRRAEELDPALNDIEVTAGYAHLGLFDHWRRAGERVIDRDPTYREGRVTFVNEHFLLNLPEEGIAAHKRLLNEAPDHRYFLLTRRVAEAAPLVEQRALSNPGNIGMTADLALLRALRERHGEARDLGRKVVGAARRTRYYHHLTYTLARTAALAGDADETARWLEETIAWGFPCYPVFSTDRFLERVRHSPRVQKVLTGLKVDWERYRAALQ